MNMEDEDAVDRPQDWIVCGRLIGRATAWDQSDTFGLMLYNWEPAEPLREKFGNGPIGVAIHFEEGTIAADHNEEGEPAIRARSDRRIV